LTEFSLECKQWRHGVEPGVFAGQMSFGSKDATVSGALECRIHAGNASEVAVKLVPIRVQLTHVKAYVVAQELVERIGR
jgi:hypothetical protein